MTHRDAAFRTTLTAVAVLATLMLAGVNAAQAQSATDRISSPLMGKGPTTRKPNAPPPSALPGAQLNQDRMIPAEHSAGDMSPTDALFDAINRGDVQAAQDAINRGADFNARNVLGLTPLDESIDLGRNNITFLLLSLRGGAEPPTTSPQKAGKPSIAAAPATLPTRSAPPASQADRTPVVAPVERPVTKAPAAAPASGNSGTPSPQNGFLGFGG